MSMVVIVFFRCSFFEHFQFGISIRVLSGLCSLSIFFLLFFSIRHRVLTPRTCMMDDKGMGDNPSTMTVTYIVHHPQSSSSISIYHHSASSFVSLLIFHHYKSDYGRLWIVVSSLLFLVVVNVGSGVQHVWWMIKEWAMLLLLMMMLMRSHEWVWEMLLANDAFILLVHLSIQTLHRLRHAIFFLTWWFAS